MNKLDLLRMFKKVNKDNEYYKSIFIDNLDNHYQSYSRCKLNAYYQILNDSYNDEITYRSGSYKSVYNIKGLGLLITATNNSSFSCCSFYFDINKSILFLRYDTRNNVKIYKIKLNKKDYKIINYSYCEGIKYIYIDEAKLQQIIENEEYKNEAKREAALKRQKMKEKAWRTTTDGLLEYFVEYYNSFDFEIINVEELKENYFTSSLYFDHYFMKNTSYSFGRYVEKLFKYVSENFDNGAALQLCPHCGKYYNSITDCREVINGLRRLMREEEEERLESELYIDAIL